MNRKPEPNLEAIELLVLDVDGVLTDGRLIIHSDGGESKCFHILDGHGIRMWQRAGLKVSLLSGRASQATTRRAQELEIAHVIQNCAFKLPALQQLLGELGLSPEKAAYVGDDLMDLPIVRYVGFGVAVANAVDELKEYADYVTARRGGEGAVREVIEHILKGSGRWAGLMERYLT
ncbi:MAG TPA: HAD hydrolase family protein [Sedimentisphaerales bacterium]|jgi:3-deoxy-D-manno-octulosonate 8-phosphate phosphatase (KDO 8-P phosphatase)|nr:HAD hydrolase family protein [Sedimentisphaerales bacterium]HNU28058.1 HAD hydrolase family protein [Sedimentisphaerales bacterium]